MNPYILFEKAYFTDGLGNPVCVAMSKKKIIQFVREHFPEAKRKKKDYPNHEMVWEDDPNQTFLTCDNSSLFLG